MKICLRSPQISLLTRHDADSLGPPRWVVGDCMSEEESMDDIDEEYNSAFNEALKFGVKILCYDCKLNNKDIKLNKLINYEKWL